jgi:hypothetical protein
MALRDHVRPELQSLVGKDPIPTLSQHKLNWVVAIVGGCARSHQQVTPIR